ncbi:alpha/beta fold hydrolase [Streptomyces chiangmaiensis]|uniref:Alpha/beta hydrolase n=1 Tax=Streptomyces chiangmaiensis TaxID=766497 RepID=A0ABU7FSY0_9ACTN|nr:alpha/beta hydrolase [Streptomyces chiangmaiensis]MED7827207.1 alpha/beta hydrolase [Streptomyces chiangmaiensis]
MTSGALVQQFTPSGIQYFQAGDGDAGLLVFTHGWRDSALGWQWAIDELLRCGATAGRRIVSVQRKEVSRHDEDTAGLLEDFASQVVEVVSHLKRPQEPIVIVGQSMGGPVAELAATHLSDALAGLMLVTPAPLAGWPLPADAVETFKAGARELDRVTAALARTQLAVNTSDTTTLRIILSTPPETERASLQSLASWIGGHPLGRQPSRVTAPTLVVVTDDTFFPQKTLGAEAAGRFADFHMAEVRGAGHMPHLERPKELAHVIAEFLATLR